MFYNVSESKSLIKHLLVADVSKRFGCLKNGVNDIKNHKFFSKINFGSLLNNKIKSCFTPQML